MRGNKELITRTLALKNAKSHSSERKKKLYDKKTCELQ